jgi:hypothetical protein
MSRSHRVPHLDEPAAAIAMARARMTTGRKAAYPSCSDKSCMTCWVTGDAARVREHDQAWEDRPRCFAPA